MAVDLLLVLCSHNQFRPYYMLLRFLLRTSSDKLNRRMRQAVAWVPAVTKKVNFCNVYVILYLRFGKLNRWEVNCKLNNSLFNLFRYIPYTCLLLVNMFYINRREVGHWWVSITARSVYSLHTSMYVRSVYRIYFHRELLLVILCIELTV